MSPVRVLAILAVVTLAGGGAVWLTFAKSEQEDEKRVLDTEREPTEAPRVPTDDSIDERIEALERRIALLERAVRLGLRSPSARALDAGAATASGNVIDNPVFEAAVRDVVDRVEGEQAEQRRQRQERRAKTWSLDTADDLGETLSLKADQKTKIAQILSDHFSAMIEARESASRDGGRWGRSQWRAAREKMEGNIGEVLTGSQRAQFDALKESGDLPGFLGRRGRDRDRDRNR